MSQYTQSAASADATPPQRTNISLKLPAIAISLMLFAFTIYTFISIRVSQGSIVDTLQKDLLEDVQAKIQLIQTTINEANAVANSLAAAAESSQYDEEGILRVIENTLKRNEVVFGSTIAYEPYRFDSELYYWSPYYNRTPENELKFTQLGNPEYDYFKWDWYAKPKERNAPALSAPYYDFGGGEIWMITASAPFYDKNGNFMGVATADIAFSQTQKIVSDIQIGEAGYAFLIDSNSVILGIGEGRGDFDVMVDTMRHAAFANAAVNWDVLIDEMTAGHTGFIEATDSQGTPLYVAYAPVGLDTGWSLALGYPREEILERTTRLQRTLLFYTMLVVIIFGVVMYLFTRTITNPLNQLTRVASQIAAEDPDNIKDQLAEPIQIETQDELEDLAIAFNKMSSHLRQSLENLEVKVAERTEGLERLTTDLRTVSEVAREIAVIRDMDTLLNVSANLIRERLRYYHVGIFLVDEFGEYAVLRAASSIAAEQMLASHYRLKVGETGLVGNVTRTGQAYIALDVGKDAVHFQNPFLPGTRSEIALPLRSHSITFGALDIQANLPNAFDEDDIQTLQILADLLAASIENVQLIQKVEEALSELTRANRVQTHQAWQTAVRRKGLSAYEYDGMQIRAMPQNLPPNLAKRLESGQPIVAPQQDESKNLLLVPLMVLNEAVGVIGLEKEDAATTWTDEEISIARAAANRAALTLENARLLEESQKRAAKERTIFEATDRIGSALSVENILQTTAEELEKALRSSEVVIQFTGHEENDPTG
ncbi:MAG: GAF domain-containing protein [Anaerolineaceae bacterium]|jgi:GAF domain-containing protein/HAMP domain-containing protein|nr:MAG: GAF domain-containing protein [Anaerolineaceae bacterium]